MVLVLVMQVLFYLNKLLLLKSYEVLYVLAKYNARAVAQPMEPNV